MGGGESTFVDGLAAAEALRVSDPAAFADLTRIPATFQKVHARRAVPVDIVARRPHIAIPPGSDPATAPITGVYWAPPFEGPLRVPAGDVRPYYRAYAAFARLLAGIEADGARFVQYRAEPGTITAFSNRRMLHGRRAFTVPPPHSGGAQAGSPRLLTGCYVDVDEFRSRLLTLAAAGHGAAAGWDRAAHLKRVGNGQVY